MTLLEPSGPIGEKLVSTATLGAELGVHPDTITRSWIPRGCPWELKLPRGYRFLMSKVKTWLTTTDAATTVSNETAVELADKVKVAFAKLESRRKGRAS